MTLKSDLAEETDLLCQEPPVAPDAPSGQARDRHYQPTRTLLIAMDLSLVLGASLASLLFRSYFLERQIFVKQLGMLLLFSVLVILFCDANDLYDQQWIHRNRFSAWRPVKSIATAALVLMSGVYLCGAHAVWHDVVVLAIAASTVALLGWRYWWRSQSFEGLNERRNVLIVGAGPVALAIRKYLNENDQLGYDIKGFLDRRQSRRDSSSSAPDYILGKIDDLESITRRYFIDEILITDISNRDLVKDITVRASLLGVDVRIVPDLYDGQAMGAVTEKLGQFPSFTIARRHISPQQMILKRLIDIAVSTIGLLLMFPCIAVIAIAIKLDSKGPAIYSAARIGKRGKTFRCHKFRTMVVHADEFKKSLSHLNERKGLLFKISDDPRITRVGRFLRKMSLDEVPQLWNVLKGEMSLVGPRPPLPSEYNEYQLEHLRRLNVLPGITGLWQVKARNSPSFEDYIDLDLEYVRKRSLWFDAVILAKTVRVVLAGTGT